MKLRLAIAMILAPFGATRAGAQACGNTPYVVDACQKTVDLVNFLTPQLSTAQAGGNATIGQGGALGGLGHVALDIRATAVNGAIPKFNNVGFSPTATATSFASESHLVPAVSVNAAVGLWRGYSLGVTHVAGIDALVTATYLQDFSSGGVNAKVSGGNAKFGYGLRVGVLEESVVSPGVALTWLKRDLPTLSVSGTAAGSGALSPGGSIAINDLAIQTSAWRITAAKSLSILGVSAGFGQDSYKTDAGVAVTVNGVGSGNGRAGMSMTRTNMFVGLALNVAVAKIVGELGQVTGGNTPTLLNNFGSSASASRTYFTLGLRVTF